MHAHTHKHIATNNEEIFIYNLLAMNPADLVLLSKMTNKVSEVGLEMNEEEAASFERFKQAIAGMIAASRPQPVEVKAGIPAGAIPVQAKQALVDGVN